ncbi:MAG TPA: GMC family oxidoreductase [Usitatibacteraceae bacterium]|nr:GMC family oxidoreductase [Usitatibacteraceae bacterium]
MNPNTIRDPIRLALSDPRRAWSVIDGRALGSDVELECDVAIVGSGAGGGVSAEILAAAGLRVVMIEEGPLKSSDDFRMREGEAYPSLYQESAGRLTRDKGITILQGRSVGGSTTVNWTSSFRTPAATLGHWQQYHALDDLSPAQMAPWFERMEQRLSIAPWPVTPNVNNDVLRRGMQALGIPHAAIQRNVKGCWNLGYCGMGCPTNAKQSMLVTTIPAALDAGMLLVHSARVLRLGHRRERIATLLAAGMDPAGVEPGARRIRVHARHVILAAGAIHSPALLMRSAIPDPHRLLGRRTFLHPSVISAALMDGPVEAFNGAPQTIYSDHFLDSLPLDGPVGFKLEAPPIHPILAGITLPGHGAAHAAWMKRLPQMQVGIALLRDGFHPESPGGTVHLRPDGSPVLDYPISGYLWDGARRALATLAEIQFAAGAAIVMPLHDEARPLRRWSDARAAIDRLDMATLKCRVASAHVMGGCAMGSRARDSVVDAEGRHHQIENLSVIDGSVFPTSIGANPQLSIYALAARNATALAGSLRADTRPTV